MEGECKNLAVCLENLSHEVRRAEEELAAAESDAATQATVMEEERKRTDDALQELQSMEGRACRVRHQLKKCQERVMAARLRNKVASRRLAELGRQELAAKEWTLKLEAVTKVAERRMKAWQVAQLQQRALSSEEVRLTQTRQEVDSLKDRCQALSLGPKVLLDAKDTVSELKLQRDQLVQKTIEMNEKLRALKVKVSRAELDVAVYQKRKEEHVIRLRIDMKQGSARNAHIAADLSKLEGEVSDMRDKLEARRRKD